MDNNKKGSQRAFSPLLSKKSHSKKQEGPSKLIRSKGRFFDDEKEEVEESKRRAPKINLSHSQNARIHS